jgi:HEAT repeat protein
MPFLGPPNVQRLIDKRDLKKLAGALADGDGQIRDHAARGLIELADGAAVPYVVDVIRDHEQQEVIGAGVRVLRELSDRSVPVLAQGLRSARAEERAAYGGLLGQLGRLGLEPLLETSRDPEPGMRAIAAMGLGLIDAGEAHARLAEIVASDESLEARAYAGFAMASHKVPGACDTLIGQFDSDDPGCRAMAASNAGVLGDARACHQLRELAETDPDQRVREAAGKAIRLIGS